MPPMLQSEKLCFNLPPITFKALTYSQIQTGNQTFNEPIADKTSRLFNTTITVPSGLNEISIVDAFCLRPCSWAV